MKEKETKLTDLEEESKTLSVEHVDNYEGPITRSKTKMMENALLLKTNHFNDA